LTKPFFPQQTGRNLYELSHQAEPVVSRWGSNLSSQHH